MSVHRSNPIKPDVPLDTSASKNTNQRTCDACGKFLPLSFLVHVKHPLLRVSCSDCVLDLKLVRSTK